MSATNGNSSAQGSSNSNASGSSDTQFNSDRYQDLLKEFKKIPKRILKKRLSKNPVKLHEYESDIKNAFKNFTDYASRFYNSLTENSKAEVRRDLLAARDKVSQCFVKLNCRASLTPRIFASIQEAELNEDSQEESDEEDLEQTSEEEEVIVNMPDIEVMAPEKFLQLAASTINKNYGGDPLALNAFINSTKLLETLAGTTHADLLRTFVLAKLEGKALESVPAEPQSLKEIIDGLKANIRPDNSKVIAGKMMALKADGQSQEFNKQAEELADALRRSLIGEGISQVKAQEMVVEKTVEMCRSLAKTNIVKSIIAASTFKDPKEVIAKFAVETATENTERQVLHFGSGNKKRKGQFRNGDFRGKGNYNNSKNYNRGYNNNNKGGRGNRRGYNNNNRGRNNYNYQNGGNYQNNNQNNNRYVRYTENSESPSQDRRGTGFHADQDNFNRNSQNVQYFT